MWADNCKRRDPDLVILAYGSNESVDDDQPIGVYKNNLREVLARLRRASPDTSCVLVGPGDFPLKRPDNLARPAPARVADIVAAQRELAQEAGCAFWDTVQFMGGEGSMAYWAAAQPAMAMSDHLHLNRRGYTRMGMALADALMFDFDGGAPTPAPGGDPVLAREGPATDPPCPPAAQSRPSPPSPRPRPRRPAPGESSRPPLAPCCTATVRPRGDARRTTSHSRLRHRRRDAGSERQAERQPELRLSVRPWPNGHLVIRPRLPPRRVAIPRRSRNPLATAIGTANANDSELNTTAATNGSPPSGPVQTIVGSRSGSAHLSHADRSHPNRAHRLVYAHTTSAPDTAAVTAPSPISTSPRSLGRRQREGGSCRVSTTTAVPCARAHRPSIAHDRRARSHPPRFCPKTRGQGHRGSRRIAA